MGRFEALAKMLGLAEEAVAKSAPETLSTLEKITTPEVSTSLQGAEKAEYLKALDEAYGDRAKRAKDLGFGDETYYHGTGDNFDEFSNDHLGKVNGPGITKNQHWASNNPEVAEVFASQSANKIKNETK